MPGGSSLTVCCAPCPTCTEPKQPVHTIPVARLPRAYRAGGGSPSVALSYVTFSNLSQTPSCHQLRRAPRCQHPQPCRPLPRSPVAACTQHSRVRGHLGQHERQEHCDGVRQDKHLAHQQPETNAAVQPLQLQALYRWEARCNASNAAVTVETRTGQRKGDTWISQRLVVTAGCLCGTGIQEDAPGTLPPHYLNCCTGCFVAPDAAEASHQRAWGEPLSAPLAQCWRVTEQGLHMVRRHAPSTTGCSCCSTRASASKWRTP